MAKRIDKTISAEEAKAASKKAVLSGKTNCPICNGELAINKRGFNHATECPAKIQQRATGERSQRMLASLSDDDKETATELASQYSKTLLRYASTLAKKPKAVRITTGDLFALATSPAEKMLLQTLLKRQQMETETAKK